MLIFRWAVCMAMGGVCGVHIKGAYMCVCGVVYNVRYIYLYLYLYRHGGLVVKASAS